MSRYRYNLSDDLLSYIKENFIERYDGYDFDDYWEEWKSTERIQVMFKIEEERLKNQGWEGNIDVKIKTSIKYYYLNINETKKSTKKKRRNYIHIDENISILMNDFIKNTKIKKPSKAFDDFVEKNKDCYNIECKRLKGYLRDKEIPLKIKKTFKNRFYLKNKT
tara:strand:- start:1694 stop:2185 length:492 start_codon:yes stop_codon:yes gene_type:complete